MTWFFKVMVTLFLLLTTTTLWALELVSPPQYTEVHPGDIITIVVKPSPGEQISTVYFDTYSGQVDAPPYEYRYTVGPNELGDVIVSMVAAKPASQGPFATNHDAVSSLLDLHLKSALLSTVKVQSLRAEFTSDKIRFYLDKDKVTGNYIPDAERLRVYGMYSDGIERDVSLATTGTTYTSSDASVLTVSIDGLMAALKPGKVQITITSGGKKLVQDATVFSK
jgi:hypothetical protein